MMARANTRNTVNVALDCVKIATVLARTGLGGGVLNNSTSPDGTPLSQKAFTCIIPLTSLHCYGKCLFFEMTLKRILKRTSFKRTHYLLKINTLFFSL